MVHELRPPSKRYNRLSRWYTCRVSFLLLYSPSALFDPVPVRWPCTLWSRSSSYTGCRNTDIISAASELRSVRLGMSFRKVWLVLTGDRVQVAWGLLRPPESFCPFPQLAHILERSVAVRAWWPFTTGALGPGCLTPNKRSIT